MFLQEWNLITYSYTAPESNQAKDNVMHYRKAAEQNTRDAQDQIKAKEEEIITANFTSGEYASLCRGETSKVPVFCLLIFVC